MRGLRTPPMITSVTNTLANVLGELPVSYAVALRMNNRGATAEQIADALGLELEAIPSLIEIGRGKVAAIIGEGSIKDGR